jgi:2-polyprenyl-3-methyl-5-hydroxy-6-metoxy-1,4-benzoquinol methylase
MEGATKVYPLDNQHPTSVDHHRALSMLFDPYTQQCAIGLLKLHGAACLEVGFGGGSFARWLADEVGPDGSVLATDIQPREIPEHPSLTVLQHDIVDEPIPGTFDLIHARLVLGHLPQQREILTKLSKALKPGGVLLLEEWWSAANNIVTHAPDAESADLVNTYSEATERVFPASGGALPWARRMHGAMLEDGLVDVHTDVHAEAWAGGGWGCQLLKATLPQLRDKLLGVGLTDDLLDRVAVLLDDPRLVLIGQLICSTSGRKPA